MRLRYIGARPVTFLVHGVGELDPGVEFEVADTAAAPFLRRTDVVPASEPRGPSKARKREAGPAVTEPATTQDTEEVCGVSDDH